MTNITILGSTGSIGTSTLSVIALHPQRFTVFALAAQKNVNLMFEQCVQYHPRYAVMQNDTAAKQLISRLKHAKMHTTVLSGDSALIDVASHPDTDYVMAAMVGAAGLLPTLAAAKAGKRILLANKEALVMSGQLLMDVVHQHQATLLPIDSEHSAIFQCLPTNYVTGHTPLGMTKITLTASGGAFRDWSPHQLNTVTPEQACQHPNWTMGAKVTVDSATMMNKGLEVIEASWLFHLKPSQIDTVLHPQSIVHSWVEYIDGSVIAQMGEPDMRTPIAYALSWPARIRSGVNHLDLLAAKQLDFKPLSYQQYPCLALAYAALAAGGTAPTLLNAANEIAVQAFLAKKIRFTDIYKIVEQTLQKLTVETADEIATILHADQMAREQSKKFVAKIQMKTKKTSHSRPTPTSLQK